MVVSVVPISQRHCGYPVRDLRNAETRARMHRVGLGSAAVKRPAPARDPNIQVEITDASEFHCFRLTLNPKSAPGQKIEIMLHARTFVDQVHQASLALSDWQAETTGYLLAKIAQNPDPKI